MKEIKNTTIYTKENIKKFFEIYYFERIKTIRIILNILIIVIIISFCTNEKNTTLDIITFIFALFGIIEVNSSLIPKLNYYKLLKKKDSILNSKVSYVFKENNFKLNKDEYIEYNTLKKVIEIETAYYLYVNNSRALILDKANLNDEEKVLLTKIFKEKVTTYKYKK